MKILMVAAWNANSPYLNELRSELWKCGMQCDVYDTSTCRLVGEKYRGGKFYQRALRSRFHLPIIGELLRKKSMLRGLAKLTGPYDVVNLHFPISRHICLLKEFKRLAPRFAITIWGSDFLRVDNAEHEVQRPLFEAADILMSNNQSVLNMVKDYYKGSENKYMLVRWGLGSLDVIDRINALEAPEQSAEKLGVDLRKINVIVGYNADPGQRHDVMLRAVAGLDRITKSRMRLLIPLTYPQNAKYKKSVIKNACETGVEFISFTEMMRVEDVARMRIITDIVINWQVDDSLSASIQEHAYCGASFVIGDWLMYSSMEKIGINFIKVKTEASLAQELGDIIKNSGIRTNMDNRKGIREFGSWQSNIGAWLKAFESI